MNNLSHVVKRVGTMCKHRRTMRVDENFVECIECGESWIDKRGLKGNENHNKRPNEFVKENKSFDRNFSRNFDNKFEKPNDWNAKYMNAIEEKKILKEKEEPYVFISGDGYMEIMVSKDPLNKVGEPIYPVYINGRLYMKGPIQEIKHFLHQQHANRVQ